jgi:hypothetical protein
VDARRRDAVQHVMVKTSASLHLVDDFIGRKRRPVHLVREGEDGQLPHAAHLM